MSSKRYDTNPEKEEILDNIKDDKKLYKIIENCIKKHLNRCHFVNNSSFLKLLK